jgi:MFS family permease
VGNDSSIGRNDHPQLRPGQRKELEALGVPALAMAFSVTIVSAYLPVVARSFTGSTTVIGVLIAGEGLMALWVPMLVGTWSDHYRNRGGSRLAFVALGTPLAAVFIVLMGVVGSLPALGLLVTLFFCVYFFTYEPYRALYPDLLPAALAGRGQGSQALWRGSGTFMALAAGGVLLSAWRVLPFLVSAVLLVAAVGTLVAVLPRLVPRRRRRGLPDRESLARAVGDVRRDVRCLVKEHPELRLYVVANCLWELSLGALKTFVVLYVTRGLGFTLDQASFIIGGVAVVILVGAVLSGKVADRAGIARTMQVGVWIYGLALTVPALTTAHAALIAAVPFIAFGGGMTMTLSYAILIPLMPKDMHGLLTGFYSMSRGLGVMLGPLLGGVAIQLLQGTFRATHGYQAVWIVTSASLLLSIPALRAMTSIREQERPRRGTEPVHAS